MDPKPAPQSSSATGSAAAKTPRRNKPRRATEPAPDQQRRQRRMRQVVWVRRVSQASFFLLFCFLLVQTIFRGDFLTATERIRLGLPVEAFFLIDPFIALLTLLSTHTVYRGLAWALGLVALTLLFGRAFCGWVCPLGTLNHVIGWLWPSRYGKGQRRISQNRTHPVRQRVKYYLLYAALAAAAVGSAVGGLLDPISLLVRSVTVAVLPSAQYATLASARSAEASGSVVARGATHWVVDSLGGTVWSREQAVYHEAWLIGLCLIGLLALNRFVPRFWCRVLCPLGALLGLLSRYALFGMRKDHEKCTDCNLCLLHCQGADSPEGGKAWRQDECHLCLNCEAACPEGVIRFGWLPHRGSTQRAPDTQRRTALGAAAAGILAVPLCRASDGLDQNGDPRVIRPPGSREERDFLARCIRCGECMKVCPNNALHPALFEAGVEGLWSPLVMARIGYCEQSCVLCAEVCPTGAIAKITEEDRLGDPQNGRRPIAIGTAFFDRGRCLPWAMGKSCTVCEEICPTSPKAIWVEFAEVPVHEPPADDPAAYPRVTTRKLGRPHVNPARCIGCGACEHVCPVRDQPAVRVTSIGESRSKRNVLLL